MNDFEDGSICGPDGCAVPEKTSAEPSPVQAGVALDILIVSDVVCPWCYVGKRRLETALKMVGGKIAASVGWLPFELNPQMPPAGIERDEYRMRKFGSLDRSRAMDAQIALAGKGEGIVFRHDLMKITPNTFNAHRLIWLAGRIGGQDALVESLFRGYFCEGLDVGDVKVLADLAAAAGMDGALVSAFLGGTEGGPQVRAEEQAAARAGITGVPAFVANQQLLFSGAQQPEVIAQVLRQVAGVGAAA